MVFLRAQNGSPRCRGGYRPYVIEKLNSFIKGRKEFHDIRFIVDDLARSKLASNQFDYIVSLGVIEHFTDPLPMLKELCRVLKPGGRIFISVPNVFAMQTITRPLTKLLGNWSIGYEKSYFPCALIKVVEKVGFSVKEAGILPSGYLFGRVLSSVPFFGELIKKIAFFIEEKQKLFGLYIYVICRK